MVKAIRWFVWLGLGSSLLSCGISCGIPTAAPRSVSRPQPVAWTPPRNPFLADSAYPLPHANCAQVDSSNLAGPTAPAHALSSHEIEYAPIGPLHFGSFFSSPYPDGHRVIWTNSPDELVKLDYDTFSVLTTYRLSDRAPLSEAEQEHIIAGLQHGSQADRLKFAAGVARRVMGADLSGVYVVLDRDGNFYQGNPKGLTVYGDARAGDRTSPITERRSWKLPGDLPGTVVGMNMTYDGWIVLATDAGVVAAVSRDLTQYRAVRLPHSEEATDYNLRMEKEGRAGYGWVRNSIAVDEQGGIYVVANGWMEKVVWNGHALSADPRDGAWVAPYSNGLGTGSGATPALMGFGDGDRLVVITDGDPLMKITLFWRDQIPAGWTPPAGALSPRVAAFAPVTMGDPNRQALQSEQAVVVAGYGGIVVNNEPAFVPPGLPQAAKALLVSLLGDDPAYTPHGVQKFEWDPRAKQLRSAWTNTEVSSPNCVPFASLASNRVYTVGVRNGQWTLEALDLGTGAAAAHYEIGGPLYNTRWSGLTLDDQGRILYGSLFGVVRLTPE